MGCPVAEISSFYATQHSRCLTLTLTRERKHTQFLKCCVFQFVPVTYHTGRWTEFKKPVIWMLQTVDRTPQKEEYRLLGYDTLQPNRSLPMFRENILPPSSRPNKVGNQVTNKEKATGISASCWLLVWSSRTPRRW
jgi:hypothetical protein